MTPLLRRRRATATALPDDLEPIELLRRGRELDVYDCWDHGRDCRVVVKTTRLAGRRGMRARRRLLAEGRMLLGLAHPHLVRCYEVRDDEPPLVVLETLSGATLSALAEEQPLTTPELGVLGLQLASALGYLHRHGILHLDVKPSNVVSALGRAVLLDLSIARMPGPGRAGLGTWCFLAPEQARGAPLTAAADVWGLAITLHFAAIGAATFDHGDERDEYPQLVRTATPVAGPVGPLLAAALIADPDRRPSLAEFAHGLAAASGVPSR